jgi:hypothetical protein
MEPTDQLDAANRRLPEGRVRRFAKRTSASRPLSILLTNQTISSTSTIARLGLRWLQRRCFGASSQGQSRGQYHCMMNVPSMRRTAVGATNPHDTRRSNCRNWQKNDCVKKFEEPWIVGAFCRPDTGSVSGGLPTSPELLDNLREARTSWVDQAVYVHAQRLMKPTRA